MKIPIENLLNMYERIVKIKKLEEKVSELFVRVRDLKP
jgi:hypothetical protein